MHPVQESQPKARDGKILWSMRSRRFPYARFLKHLVYYNAILECFDPSVILYCTLMLAQHWQKNFRAEIVLITIKLDNKKGLEKQKIPKKKKSKKRV